MEDAAERAAHRPAIGLEPTGANRPKARSVPAILVLRVASVPCCLSTASPQYRVASVPCRGVTGHLSRAVAYAPKGHLGYLTPRRKDRRKKE